ncbi:hypothetical protein ACLB1M_06625 [Escherichia coli]
MSARNGGDMGWLEDATIPDELKNAGLKEKGNCLVSSNLRSVS